MFYVPGFIDDLKNVRRAPSLTEERYNRLEGKSTFLPSLRVKAVIFRDSKHWPPEARAHLLYQKLHSDISTNYRIDCHVLHLHGIRR